MGDIPLHKTIHFIGIGGAGMSAIAKVAIEKGYKVSGSDLKESIHTIRLKDLGAEIHVGHKPANLRKADIIVISTAIPEDNPELQFAKQERIPMIRRADMLDLLMADASKRIGVAGTHGKTTTSSMITQALAACGKVPTFVIGAELKDFGSNGALGNSDYFVAEADESDGSFLCLHPNIGVITNVEADHLDYYKEFQHIQDHFRRYIQAISDINGYVVLNLDDPILKELGTQTQAKAIYYSLKTPSAVMARDIVQTNQGTRYTLVLEGTPVGEVQLQVHGLHNVMNSLAVIALGVEEKLPLEKLKKGLASFSGTKRRFQLIGQAQDILVYDDYAHHPTEIDVTLKGAKAGFKQRIICIFQPHRYTRTRDLMDSFSDAFSAADEVFITDIYSANEKKIEGVSSDIIVNDLLKKGVSAHFIPKKSNVAQDILPYLKPHDLVITMGAGDIYTVAKELVAQLKTSAPVGEAHS